MKGAFRRVSQLRKTAPRPPSYLPEGLSMAVAEPHFPQHLIPYPFNGISDYRPHSLKVPTLQYQKEQWESGLFITFWHQSLHRQSNPRSPQLSAQLERVHLQTPSKLQCHSLALQPSLSLASPPTGGPFKNHPIERRLYPRVQAPRLSEGQMMFP